MTKADRKTKHNRIQNVPVVKFWTFDDVIFTVRHKGATPCLNRSCIQVSLILRQCIPFCTHCIKKFNQRVVRLISVFHTVLILTQLPHINIYILIVHGNFFNPTKD